MTTEQLIAKKSLGLETYLSIVNEKDKSISDKRVDDYEEVLHKVTRKYIQRNATIEDISFLFSNPDNFDTILSDVFDPVLRGQFVEFLRQEYLHFEDYTQLDKHHKTVTDFKYEGSDRTDIRAFKMWSEDNIEVRSESGKWVNHSLGVADSDIESAQGEGEDVRTSYLGCPTARLVIAVICPHGVTPDVHKWFNAKKLSRNIFKLEILGPKDVKTWWTSLGYTYQKQDWEYRKSESSSSVVNYYYHQQRLQKRWITKMVNGKLKLLVVWGCRTGKTYGVIGLLKKYADITGKQLKVCVVTQIPSLFKDWDDSIKTIFGKDNVVIHRHRSGEVLPITTKHQFVLSSSQMLNPEDSELGIDKETNKKVLYTSKFDALVYDEGHLGLTADNTYTQVIKKIKHEHLFGLTATPFRCGLLDDSIFTESDVFDYWQQMILKENGHPDYQNVAERFLLSIKPTQKMIALFKHLDLLSLGTNINSIYGDSGMMNACISIMNQDVFSNTKLLGDSSKHRIKDIIIRAAGVTEGETLLTALREWINPLTNRGLDNHLFGLSTGEIVDMPGVSAVKGDSDKFKDNCDQFFSQNVDGITRKVLIVVDQGIVGHTYETVNTTIDLTSGLSLIAKYQFWDRGGTKFTYADGYVKETYYHFDFDINRLLEMGQDLYNSKKSDKSDETTDKQFFEMLNIFEIDGGTVCEQINQTEFKERIEKLMVSSKLSKLLPSPEDIIVTDGTFNSFNISKAKNGFGNTTIGDDDNDDDGIDKKSASKRLPSKKPGQKINSSRKLDKSTRNAVEKVIMILPVLALYELIEDRQNCIDNDSDNMLYLQKERENELG